MNNRNLLVLLISMVIIVLLPVAASASSWPSFQGSNDNNGVTGEDITTTFAENWTAQTAAGAFSGLDSGAVIDGDNNVTYCVAYNGSVYAFDLITGDKIWKTTSIGNDDPWNSELSVPAYNNDRLYVGLTNGSSGNGNPTIYALNATDGSVVWSNSDNSDFPLDHQLNSPIKYDSGKLYFGSVELNNYVPIGGYFYCVDASNGQVIWRYDDSTKGYYGAAPAIIGDYVVVGDDAGIVRAFNKIDGTLVDTLDTPLLGSIRSGIVSETTIYYTTKNKINDANSGSLAKASFDPINGKFGANENEYLEEGLYSTSTPAVTGDYIYLGTDDGNFPSSGTVNCYDKNLNYISGATVDGAVKASPVVTTNTTGQERVYVTTNNETGSCYYLNFTNGAYNSVGSGSWVPPGSNYTLQGIAFANGWLVYGNDAGYLYGATGF